MPADHEAPMSPTRPATTDDPRWAQVQARDTGADGVFWYGVATTGVYCRPSCPSRPANPRNVMIYPTIEAARAAGLRPCRRCDPDRASQPGATAALVTTACRSIETAETAPSLAALAAGAGLSPGHFHRLFRQTTGLTPRGYALAIRASRTRSELGSATTVTEAIYGAGFGSTSRFYETAPALLGMTPGRVRDGGAGEVLRFAVGQSTLGAILVASSARGVAAILLGDDPELLVRDLQDRFPQAQLIGGAPDYEALVARVVGFIEAPRIGLDLPLDIRGTAFQQRVWQALRAIPPGHTATYADIATRIGAPGSARAVAGACAANRLAVAIPCHRIIRQDGSLSGYRWGVARKRELLERESSARA